MEARKFQADVLGSSWNPCFFLTKEQMIFTTSHFGWLNPHTIMLFISVFVGYDMLSSFIIMSFFLVMSKHLSCFTSAFSSWAPEKQAPKVCRRKNAGGFGEFPISLGAILSASVETPMFSGENIPTYVVLLLKSNTWCLVLSKLKTPDCMILYV